MRQNFEKDRSRTEQDLSYLTEEFQRDLMYVGVKTQKKNNNQKQDQSVTNVEEALIQFKILHNQHDDQEVVNHKDIIFTRVADEQQLKQNANKSACSVCFKEFSLLNKKHQCKFCSNCACKEHSRKKRADPKDKTIFLRICDICEDKYIKLSVQEGYIQKRNQLNLQLSELETKSQEVTQEVKRRQAALQAEKERMNQIQNEYSNQTTLVLFNVSNVKQDNKLLRDEIESFKRKLQACDSQITDIYNRMGEKEESLNKKLGYGEETNASINSTEASITDLSQQIEYLNQKLTEKHLADDKRRKIQDEINVNSDIYRNIDSTIIDSGQPIDQRKKLLPVDQEIKDKDFCQKCIIF